MKYPLPMRIMHWLIAIIVICQLTVGIYMAGLPNGALHKMDWYFWHKSFGVLILGLVCLGVLIRSRSVVPPPQPGLAPWEVKTSFLAHRALYALLFLVPLCGYIMSVAYTKGSGVSFFGLFTLPNLVPKNDALSGFFRESHKILAFTLLGVIVVHVMAVLKHRFYDKNDVLKRML